MAQGANQAAGVIPRAIFDVFGHLKTAARSFTVRMSYLELYNEDLYDLLVDAEHQRPLQVTGRKSACSEYACTETTRTNVKCDPL